MEDLVSWLDSIDGRPGLNELEVRLKSSEFNLEALRKCITTTDDGYQRNVIKRTDHYELVAICWKPGQITPIHDHRGSDCAFIILEESQRRRHSKSMNQGQRYTCRPGFTSLGRFALQMSPIFTKL